LTDESQKLGAYMVNPDSTVRVLTKQLKKEVYKPSASLSPLKPQQPTVKRLPSRHIYLSVPDEKVKKAAICTQLDQESRLKLAERVRQEKKVYVEIAAKRLNSSSEIGGCQKPEDKALRNQTMQRICVNKL